MHFRSGRALAAIVWLAGCGQLLGLEEGKVQGTCTTNAECAPGHGCLLGACRSGCSADVECGTGSRCLKAIGTSACLPASEGCAGGCPEGTTCADGACRTACQSDDDCSGGQECQGDVCLSTNEVPAAGGTSGSGGTGGSAGGMGGAGGSTAGTAGSAGAGGGGGSAPVLDGPCDQNAALACNGSAQKVTLICQGGTWQPNDTCSSSTNCDQSTGLCEPIPAECADHVGGERFCAPDDVLTECGPDLVSTTVVEQCEGLCAEMGLTAECLPPMCRDGKTQPPEEECDDGNDVDTDDCTNGCQDPICQDGIRWAGHEDCDDGNGDDTDNCTHLCQLRHDWALWPMPNPVSTGLPNPSSYDTTSTEVVIDNVTGLMWQRGGDMNPRTFANAASYCADLSLDGHSDWRVPTRIELVSLIDPALSPAIDSVAFPNTPVTAYWTSSYSPLGQTNAFAIGFNEGTVANATANTSFLVRCVR